MIKESSVDIEFEAALYVSNTTVRTTPDELIDSVTLSYTITQTRKVAIDADLIGSLPEFYSVDKIDDLIFDVRIGEDQLPEGYSIRVSLYRKDDNGRYVAAGEPVALDELSVDGNDNIYSFDLTSLGNNM